MVNLLIDCDPGIDDSLAILMVLNHLSFFGTGNLSAITTVGGNATIKDTTANTYSLLNYYKEKSKTNLEIDNVPVGIGSSNPIEGKFNYAYEFHGENGIGIDLCKYHSRKLDLSANEILSNITNGNNKTDIIALGPLTNIAIALKNDLQFRNSINSITIMGGAVNSKGNITPFAEFNIYNDPIAADYIHTSGFTTWQKASNILIRHPNSESTCNSGGGTTSAKYFAYPFSVGSSSINAKFFGLNLSTTSGLNKISIYNISSNSPGSSLYSTTNVNFDYFDEVYNLTCSSSYILAQAYFENGISLSANTNYYIIFEYSSAVSNTINTKTGSVSLPVKRKYSNDLTNWSDWDGWVSGRYPTDSGIFFIAN